MPKTMTLLAAAAVSASLMAGASQAGCLGGAVVGGVAGHFAGRHATVGALGGCAVGHHMSAEKRRRAAERNAPRDNRGPDRRG